MVQMVKEAWYKWSKVNGVILDMKILLKLRIKEYNNGTRPVLLYGTETRSLRKEEDILQRIEMRVVRWIARISLLKREKVKTEEFVTYKRR